MVIKMENFLNIDEMNVVIDNFEIYKNDESLNFDDIKNTLTNINHYYKTDNTKQFIDLDEEFITKMNTITKLHDTNVTTLKKTVQTYVKTAKDVAQSFSDIGDNNG